MPPILVIGGFILAVAGALALMAYLAWRGSKPSEFFVDAVSTTYELQLPEAEIDAYYDMKEKLQRQHPPAEGGAGDDDPEALEAAWAQSIPVDDRQNLKRALMRRLVSCIEKLDQVQRDKPGNWKLWRGKLVSERFWSSLCDAEKLVSEEIDSCVAEAEVLEPGWRQHIFPQAVQIWRLQKQQDFEKKVHKKAVVSEKKEKEREIKKKEVEERQKEEDKLKQERLAEKAMEKLLREEEKAAAAKSKAKPKAKADAKQKVTKRK
mmetsp:Transcript_78527/g.230339  ORF Transcript_78527/g.230339 Transcript_78527/m.230339 type:complete len:263 (+) Transcript_78527:87-875(+)